MKKTLIAALAAVTALGAATTAAAQPYGGYHNNRAGYDQRYDRYDRYDRRDARQDRREVRQHRRWARGQYMPSQYRGSRYVVNDYQRYRLAPPPRGYHYVRDGNDVVLAAVATGLIAMVIAGAMN